MLLTRAEFRRIRDEEALKSYRKRWPGLKQRQIDLNAELAVLRERLKHADKRQQEAIENDMRPLQRELAEVIGDMELMERDANIRKERLGNTAWETIK